MLLKPNRSNFSQLTLQHQHQIGLRHLFAFALPRVLIGLLMSSAGLANRMSYAQSNTQLLLDLLAIIAENNLILSIGALLVRALQDSTSYRKLFFYVLLLLLGVLSQLFAFSDYMFQSLTGGVIPTLWIIASGLRDAGLQLNSQLRSQFQSVLFSFGAVLVCYIQGVILFIVVSKYSKRNERTDMVHNRLPLSTRGMLINAAVVVSLWALGGWAPVTNSSLCVLGSLVLSPPGASVLPCPVKDRVKLEESASIPPPNIVLVVHESLSTSLLECTRGQEATPFYHRVMSNISEVIQFQNARTIAGVTTIATPGILTGLMPYDDNGRDLTFGATIASEFKARNYATAMFSSYGTDWKGTAWSMLNPLMTHDYDTVVDPALHHDELVNESGMEDWKTVAYFNEWIQKKQADESTRETPFFAVVIFFNNHYPHLVDDDFVDGGNEDRYFSSLKTMDKSLEQLFSSLRDSGVLSNTLMFGAGDHGETPGKLYKRLAMVDAPILGVPLWMHVPEHLLSPSQHLRLHENRNRAVSTLDIVPTLREMLGYQSYTERERETCVVGQSLLQSISSERIVEGWHGSPIESAQIGALSMEDEAIVFRSKDPEKSFMLEFKTDDNDPVQKLFETRLGDLSDEQKRSWTRWIKRLNSPMVERRMPGLLKLLETS